MLGIALRIGFGKFDLTLGRRAEAGADLEHLLQSIDHDLGAMTKKQRSPRADVVDVRIPVDVDKAGPFTARDESGCTANSAECPDRRIYASGRDFLRTSEQLF